MRKAVSVCIVLTLLIAVATPAFAASRPELTYAQTWDDGIAEAKARKVPVVLIWPERG
jgi:hypothetical protein